MIYSKQRNSSLYEDIFFVSESSNFLFFDNSVKKNIISTTVCFGVEKSNQKQQKLASIFLSFLTATKPICKVFSNKFSKNTTKGFKNKIDFKVFFSNITNMYNHFYYFFSTDPFLFHKFIIDTVVSTIYSRQLIFSSKKVVRSMNCSRTTFAIAVKNMFTVKKFRYFVDLSSFLAAFTVNVEYRVYLECIFVLSILKKLRINNDYTCKCLFTIYWKFYW